MDEGEIQVDSINQIGLPDITGELARESGFLGVVDLLKVTKHGKGENIYLVRFHYVRPSVMPRVRVSLPDVCRRDLLGRILPRGWFAASGSSFGYKGKSASHILPGLTAYSRFSIVDAHQMNRSLDNCTRRW
jgi:hypothetical protein